MLFCTALALAAASCSDDDDPTRPQPTTTAPDTTQPQPETETDEQALQALAEDWYEAVRAVYFDGSDSSTLEELAVDPYLSDVLAQVADFEQSGNRGQPSAASRHEVVSIEVDDQTALLVECVIDADVLMAPDGTVLNDTVQANLYETDAVAVEGGWRFQERRTLQEIDGSDQCPA